MQNALLGQERIWEGIAVQNEIERERLRITLERILFHLDETTRFCNRLDLSALSTLERNEWESKIIKHCKDAMAFTKDLLQKLKLIWDDLLVVRNLKASCPCNRIFIREELVARGCFSQDENMIFCV